MGRRTMALPRSNRIVEYEVAWVWAACWIIELGLKGSEWIVAGGCWIGHATLEGSASF
jgi:hypothetical protein